MHTDPVVALNVLRLFYSRGRGRELSSTLEWVLGVLEHRAYIEGTRYYETAECFLFFASQLMLESRDARLHGQLFPLLRERIIERAGAAGDALALSMRVLAGKAVGVRLERELAELLPLQYEDGGWGPSWVYKYGRTGIKIGNRGLTTAFALNAIEALRSSPQLQSLPLSVGRRSESEPEAELLRLPAKPLLLQLRLGVVEGLLATWRGRTRSWSSVTWWLIFLTIILSGFLSRL